MTVFHKARRGAAALIAASLIVAAPALAQEISDSHLKAARTAISAVKATDEFDKILPAAAAQLKAELIQRDPHLEQTINEIVDTEALKLAARRGDLEREAALSYARAFTEAELNEISAFYASPTGRKFQDNGVKVTAELYQAADIWQRGLSRDLTAAVTKALDEQRPDKQAGTPEEKPAQ